MADKGGSVVVMTNTQYRKMCTDILSNRQWYKIIDSNCIDRFQRQFRDIVITACADGLISGDTIKFILIEFPVVPAFYSIPKIHKRTIDPPGRPIVYRNTFPYIKCK